MLGERRWSVSTWRSLSNSWSSAAPESSITERGAEPSAEYYGLVPVKLAPALHADAAEWPTNELFLVTHRTLRDVPRVRAVWDLLLEPLRSRRH